MYIFVKSTRFTSEVEDSINTNSEISSLPGFLTLPANYYPSEKEKVTDDCSRELPDSTTASIPL